MYYIEMSYLAGLNCNFKCFLREIKLQRGITIEKQKNKLWQSVEEKQNNQLLIGWSGYFVKYTFYSVDMIKYFWFFVENMNGHEHTE
jgi:hypothetical protein